MLAAIASRQKLENKIIEMRVGIFVTVLFLSVSVARAEITLIGNAPRFAGQTIFLYKFTDFFTQTRIEQQNFLISREGDFSILYEVSNPLYIEISLNGNFSGLYVQPNFTYKIVFDKKGEIEQVISDDKTNSILRIFEEEDYELYKYQSKKVYAEKIEEFIKAQNEKGKSYGEFLNTILSYRIARREFWICADKGDFERANKLENELLSTRSVNNNIPDYFGFLKTYSWGRQNTFKLRRVAFDGKNIIKTFLDEAEAIPNDSIQQYATLTFLEKAYQSDWGKSISKERINELIDSISQVAVLPEIRNTARLILRKNNSLNIGDIVRDFSFETSNGESLKLSSFRGKYVLIDFWFVGCSSCIENFPRLKQLKGSSPDKLEIISLTPYDTTERINAFLRKHSQYDWLFSPIDKRSELLDYFNILYFPTYYLISPNGELIKRINHIDIKDNYENVVKLIN